MERAAPQLTLRRPASALAGAALCFLAGWTLAVPRNPTGGGAPLVENKEPPASGPGPSGQAGRGGSFSGGGTFADLMAMDAAAARLKPEEWPRLWRERMRTGDHLGLTRAWVKADPGGALKTALAAADDLSLSDQEGYDFQYLGEAAINELFSRDLPSALRAMRDWRGRYDRYPRLDCLHLLVTGDAAQKAALVDFLRGDGAEKIRAGQTGDPLKVLEALNQPGMPARPDLEEGIVWEAIQTRPGETVDWILKRGQPVSPQLMERALNGLNSAVNTGSSRETTEAIERLLEIAPPDTVDSYAESFAYRKAALDPGAARRWAEEHVPESRFKQVLERLAAMAAGE